MRCEQARQLFDAYLNGELSPSLTTELGAHRLRCPDCRRALALLEVSGHIVASDRDPVALRGDFTNRLMACMQTPRLGWVNRFRRALYVAGPLAAAAVVALAFLGVFDRPRGPVLGRTETGAQSDPRIPPGEREQSFPELADDGQRPESGYRDERAWEAAIEAMQKNMASKRQSGESLQKAFDLTVEQLLDTLREAEQESDVGQDAGPDDATIPIEPSEADPAADEEVEDL